MPRNVAGAAVATSDPDSSVYSSSLETIGRHVISGHYPTGTPLDLDTLGRDVDASRSVIREVLRVLGSMGLVRAWPRRGTFVEPRRKWNWLDPLVLKWYCAIHDDFDFLDTIAEMRRIIEPQVARLAAQRRSEPELAALRHSLEQMSGNGASFIDGDVAFHRQLMACSHNELLTPYSSVIEAALRTHTRLAQAGRDTDESLAIHRILYQAVQSQSPDAAEDAMNQILAQAQTDLERAREVSGRGHELHHSQAERASS